MECITAWLEGIPDTWLRVIALAGPVGLFLAAYQMVTGWRANSRLKRLEKLVEQESGTREFVFQKLGDRSEIRGHTTFDAPEMTVSVGKRTMKKPIFLLRLRRLLGKLLS